MNERPVSTVSTDELKAVLDAGGTHQIPNA